MGDGFPTKITINSAPTAAFWEVTVTPPALDGMDAIDTTTMHSVTWRNKAPRALITMGDVKCTALYNASVYTNILALINKRDTITVSFPDGSTLAAYGFLRQFEPQEMSEGTTGKANIVFSITNEDPASGLTAPPVYTPGP
jgi:hypothetical protein